MSAISKSPASKEEPPIFVESLYFGLIPRYSASIRFGDQAQFPAQKSASTSSKRNPASSRAPLAAWAWSCSAVLPGVRPRSDSATPTIAAQGDEATSLGIIYSRLYL